MRKIIVSISLLIVLTGILDASSHGGKHYSFFGGGGGGYHTSYADSADAEDEDNPNFLAKMLETDKQKAARETRISIKQNIACIFSEIIPKYENTLWVEKNKDISKNSSFGEVSWRSTDSKESLTISYENVGNNHTTQYKTLSEYLDFYKKQKEQNDNQKVSFTILSQNQDSALVLIEHIERGTSDQLKKNTQVKIIEKWLTCGDWLIGVSYGNLLAGNPEKNEAWPELQKVWENRFAKIQFSN